MGWGRSSLLAWTLPNYSVFLTYTPLNLKPTQLYTPLCNIYAFHIVDLSLARKIAFTVFSQYEISCFMPPFMSTYTSVTFYNLFSCLFFSQDKWNPQFLKSINLWFHSLKPWCTSRFHIPPATSFFCCLGVGLILVLSSLILCSATDKQQIVLWKLWKILWNLQTSTSDNLLQLYKVNHLSLLLLYLLHLRNIKHC